MSRTLAQRLDDGPVGPLEAQRIALHALDALRAAHKQDRVHAELAPDAILIEPDGRATLTDRWIPASPDAKSANTRLIAVILGSLFPSHPVLLRAQAEPPDVATLRRDLVESFHKTR